MIVAILIGFLIAKFKLLDEIYLFTINNIVT